MAGLESMVAEFWRQDLVGDLWVDGSFLTIKIDPADVDIVLAMKADFVSTLTATQHNFLEWYSSNNLKDTDYCCDNYFFVEYPESHKKFASSVDRRSYWRKWFSTARDGKTRKGIARLSLADRPVQQRTDTRNCLSPYNSIELNKIEAWGQA